MKTGDQKGPEVPKVDIDKLAVHVCECGSAEYLQVLQIRQCPASIGPQGKAALIPITLRAICIRCGRPPIWKEKGDVQQLPLEGNVPGAPEGGKE